jgi:hypothetical protein
MKLFEDPIMSTRVPAATTEACPDVGRIANPIEAAVASARYLSEVEERAIVQEWLPKLKAGPYQSGALRWEDIEGEWDEGPKARSEGFSP